MEAKLTMINLLDEVASKLTDNEYKILVETLANIKTDIENKIHSNPDEEDEEDTPEQISRLIGLQKRRIERLERKIESMIIEHKADIQELIDSFE